MQTIKLKRDLPLFPQQSDAHFMIKLFIWTSTF